MLFDFSELMNREVMTIEKLENEKAKNAIMSCLDRNRGSMRAIRQILKERRS